MDLLDRFRSHPKEHTHEVHAMLTIAVWLDGEQWLSECVELGVGSFGRTPDEAYEQGIDAVCTYLNALEDLGDRERVFAEKSIATWTQAPAEYRLADLPRELAERTAVQVRPYLTPSLFAH